MSISDKDYERIDAQDAMADLDEMTEWCICPDCGGQKDIVETWEIGGTAVCDNCLPARIAKQERDFDAAFRACVAVAAYYPGGINPDLDAAVQECRVIALGKEVSDERS